MTLAQFEKIFRELIAEGHSTDNAFNIAAQSYEKAGKKADELIKIKLKVEREKRK